MSDERRRFTRVPFGAEVEICADGVLYRAQGIRNLSVGGCLLPLEAHLRTGTPCRINIRMEGTVADLEVRAEGEIARSSRGSIAVQFTRLDPESLFHLQNIIRYNAAEPETVEEEILAYLHGPA